MGIKSKTPKTKLAPTRFQMCDLCYVEISRGTALVIEDKKTKNTYLACPACAAALRDDPNIGVYEWKYE